MFYEIVILFEHIKEVQSTGDTVTHIYVLVDTL